MKPNPEHLKILKTGVDSWNEWRIFNPGVRAELSSANLRGAKLGSTNLSGADLRGAKLRGADLNSANLSGAELSEAEVHEADLRRADFSKAELNEADLSKADLRGADLSNADFSSADLSGVDLRGAELIQANLSWAKLKGAFLNQANLRGANLGRANLGGAELSGANLGSTNLRGADLRRADLRRADLSSTNLNGADLSGADLREAFLIETNFSSATLIGTKFEGAAVVDTHFDSETLGSALGLAEIEHFGPSSIGLETLEACGQELPDAFLKGIGFKDWEILAIRLRDPSLREDQVIDITYKIADMRTNSPIQTNSIFFSYSSQDVDFVESVEKRFAKDHIQSWRDVREISAGPIEAQLDRAIELNRTVMLVLSENSVNSEWVLYEVRKARKLKAKLDAESKKPTHVLCPVALDDSWKSCAWPPRIREDLEDYHILDCSDWQEPSFDAKYEKLKTNLGIYYFGQDRKQ